MVYGQDTQVFWRWVTGVPLVFIEQYRTLAFHLPTVSTCPNRSIDLPPPLIDYSKVPFETECQTLRGLQRGDMVHHAPKTCSRLSRVHGPTSHVLPGLLTFTVSVVATSLNAADNAFQELVPGLFP